MKAYTVLRTRIASRLVVLVSGISVASIGSTTVLGYVLGMAGFYQWSDAVAMSPNSGVAFVLTGLAISILGASNRVWKCSN